MQPRLSIIVGSGNPLYSTLFLHSLATYSTMPYDLHFICDHDLTIPNPPEDRNCKNLYTTFQGPGWSGVAHNWNLGLTVATGEYQLIINDDTLFTESWMDRLFAFIDEHKDLGCVCPTWLWTGNFPDAIHNVTPEKAWEIIKPWNAQCSSQALSYGQTHVADIDQGMQGCFFVLKKEMLDDLKQFEQGMEPLPGKFDEITFSRMNFEDNDLYMRMHRAGYAAQVTHSCALLHYGSQTVARPDVKQTLGDGYALNLPKFLKKWHLEHLAGKPFTVHNSIYISAGEKHPNV